MKVKILSGWSNPGGSTLHFIALTNLLNANGYDCTFYGPHDWHLDQCQSCRIAEYVQHPEDTVISHFLNPTSFICRKHILSCHETNLYEVKTLKPVWDAIHMVSKRQVKWHNLTSDPNVMVIPPIIEKIDWVDPKDNIAGIIGSIDSHKQTHLSIEAAKRDGFEVILFGEVTDPQYYYSEIANAPVTSAYEPDKKRMYSKLSAVYHHSKFETYGMVEAECKLAGIPFKGHSNNPEILTEEEILERWSNLLE